jgi:secondary thiamine-phosphate synthase enzyme
MRTHEFEIDTAGHLVTDITEEISRFATDGGEDGLVNVFLPHATCGVALMETGSGSEADLDAAVERLLPRDDRYTHAHGPAGHGGDHLLPVFVSPSLLLPVDGGRLVLGYWQSVVVVDPNRSNNRRRVRLALVPS